MDQYMYKNKNMVIICELPNFWILIYLSREFDENNA